MARKRAKGSLLLVLRTHTKLSKYLTVCSNKNQRMNLKYSRAEAKLKTLPTITVPNDELTATGWDITPATEKFPYPNDSEVYKVIQSVQNAKQIP